MKTSKKPLLILGLCLYAAQSYSINTYNRFAQPALVAKEKLAKQLDKPEYVENSESENQNQMEGHPVFPSQQHQDIGSPVHPNREGHPSFPPQSSASVGTVSVEGSPSVSHHQSSAPPAFQQEGHPVFPTQEGHPVFPTQESHPVFPGQQQGADTPTSSQQQATASPFPEQQLQPQSQPQSYQEVASDNTGDVVGDRYVLDGDPKMSSGKSFIYEAYHQNQNEEEPVIVKLSDNTEALEREAENFGRIAKCEVSKKLFVQVHDYIEEADPNNAEMEGQGALVMERGEQDLRSFVRKNGPLQGPQLRDAAKAAAKVVRAVHNSDMVWTEIKAANFVVKENHENGKAFAFDVKGIDLESAVPHKNNPIDYSPEACPPEFAVAFLCGREPYMEMDYAFDIWSLGMVFFKLSTGAGYFDPDVDDKVDIATTLKNGDQIDLDKIQDPQMKDLVQRCLAYTPDERPSIDEVLKHPFFQK